MVASALAGGDCINDADALCSGETGRVLGYTVKAPSTLGTFLRSFRWGHARQFDRVTRALLARAWAAGAGPGEQPLTIDIYSTLCETYSRAKEGARQPGYTGARGYHPLLAVAAGSGEELMARLRQGRVHSARGAAHFLRETVNRVRAAGTSGQLTLRADSGFYRHAVVHACRAVDVRFSVTVRQLPQLRTLIEAIAEDDWTPIPYWLEDGADVAETSYTPFAHKQGESAIRDLKYGVGLNHLPSGPLAANAAWLAVQVIDHNLARWTARLGLGEAVVTTKTLRQRCFALAGRLTPSARRWTLHLPRRWSWSSQLAAARARIRALPLPA